MVAGIHRSGKSWALPATAQRTLACAWTGFAFRQFGDAELNLRLGQVGERSD